MPKCSIVVPVFEGDAYLSETLESLRNQTERDIEIIVVNDASPDYTEELLIYYVNARRMKGIKENKEMYDAYLDNYVYPPWMTKKPMDDPRIRYYRFETNKGVCEARNFGNEMASSDLILVSDQDDLSSPNRIEISLAFMEANPEIDCITSGYLECNVDGQPVKEYHPEDMTREIFERGGFVWFHSSACYRKKDILELPYREVQGATDDWVFLDTWTQAGKKFKTLPDILGKCRRLPGGQMQQRRAAQGLPPSFIL